MRKLALALVAVAMLGMLAMPRTAAAEDKGIVALQQSVSLLMSQLADLQKSFNQQIGMIQGLVTQNTDTVNKLSSALTTIQTTLNGNQLVSAQHQTDISKQFQALADSVAALQAHLQKMDVTLQQVHQMQQTIPAPPVASSAAPTPGSGAAGAPGVPGGVAAAGTNPTVAPAVPQTTQIYQQALNDFQSGAPQAQTELARFIQDYPNDPQVPDATYFLGTLFYQKQQYDEAIQQFNQLITLYPDDAKTPLAELNKGICLSKEGNRTAALSEFRALAKNHPGTEAAREAAVELHRLERTGN
ncbi:MAG: tetratricopeptide repeat protein [Terriglobales bacterium]